MLFYTGENSQTGEVACLLGIVFKGSIRVILSNGEAREAERFGINKRIREVEQGPNGAIWLLEDGRRGGQLMKLTALNTDS